MPGSRSLPAVLLPARTLVGQVRATLLFLGTATLLWLLVRLAGGDGSAAAWFPPAGLEFACLTLVGVRALPLVIASRLFGQTVVFPALMAAHPGRVLTADLVAVLVFAATATLLRRCWRPRSPVASLAWFVLCGLVLA